MSLTNPRITKFEREKVSFGGGIYVDGYRMPNGEFRVGMTGASLALGYAKNWLSEVSKKSGKRLKALQDEGWVGSTIEGIVKNSEKNGNGIAKTISLDDFNALIDYAAFVGRKPEARALSKSLRKMTLLDFFHDAFGEKPLTIAEKRELFYKEYAKTIDWLQEDKDDWVLIVEQQIFIGGCNV